MGPLFRYRFEKYLRYICCVYFTFYVKFKNDKLKIFLSKEEFLITDFTGSISGQSLRILWLAN